MKALLKFQSTKFSDFYLYKLTHLSRQADNLEGHFHITEINFHVSGYIESSRKTNAVFYQPRGYNSHRPTNSERLQQKVALKTKSTLRLSFIDMAFLKIHLSNKKPKITVLTI